MKMPRSWLLPQAAPVLELLVQQMHTVSHSVDQVCAWSDGVQDLPSTVTALRADRAAEREQRRILHQRVIEAFSTPLGAEDIYELSERVGVLQTQLYLLVREVDVSATTPDPGLAAMMHVVASAIRPLSMGVQALPQAVAADHADEAAAILEQGDRAYRHALGGLTDMDIRQEIRLREVYRRAEHITDATAAIAHRTWYSVCKSG